MRLTSIPAYPPANGLARLRSPRLCFLILVLCGLATGCNNTSSAEPVNRKASHLVFTRHARCRMDCRHIDENEVMEILHNGVINYRKSEPNSKPDPKYAFEGKTHNGEDLRIIFAPSSRGLVVITVIDLDREWPCHCN